MSLTSGVHVEGFKAFAELVRRSGIEVVFTMMGAGNVTWMGHGVEEGYFRLVSTRHEETAVGAAVGYSRTTNAVTLCGVTRGPGFANAVNAMIAAAHSHVPVVLVVGESPPSKKWTPQVLDQRGMADVMGVGFHHASSGRELEATFHAAMAAARVNGLPQVLSIGDGVMADDAPLSEAAAPTPHPAAVDQESIDAAIDVIAGARQPVVIAGRGALLSDCRDALWAFADLIGARVATTLAANRFFSGHPHDLGVSGNVAMPEPREILARSDVVVSVGAGLNPYTTSQGDAFGSAKIIQIEVDVDRPFRASSPELGLLGDAREVVDALTAAWNARGLPAREFDGPTPGREDNRAAILALELGHDPKRGLDSRDVYTWFDRTLPEDRIVVTDGGRAIGGAMPSLVDARDALSWVTGTSFQSIGQGLGIAIGAATAHPDRPVVLFCGDGGFSMALSGLDVVRLHGITNLSIVIMNDRMYGTEGRYLRGVGLPTTVVEQPLLDVTALAGVFGADGVVVTTMDELAGLEIPGKGCTIVDVRLDPHVDIRNI